MTSFHPILKNSNLTRTVRSSSHCRNYSSFVPICPDLSQSATLCFIFHMLLHSVTIFFTLSYSDTRGYKLVRFAMLCPQSASIYIVMSYSTSIWLTMYYFASIFFHFVSRCPNWFLFILLYNSLF